MGLGKLAIYVYKNESDYYWPCIKTDSECTEDPKTGPEALGLSEERQGKRWHKDFLERSPQTQETTLTTYKWDFRTLKSICTAKEARE